MGPKQLTLVKLRHDNEHALGPTMRMRHYNNTRTLVLASHSRAGARQRQVASVPY